MSEEIKRPGTEMNDAALEGVSGGLSAYEYRAEVLCGECPRFKKNCGTHSSRWSELVKYMEAHGYVNSYSKCPFYND